MEDGAAGGVRTPDLTLRRRSLYPSELQPRRKNNLRTHSKLVSRDVQSNRDYHGDRNFHWGLARDLDRAPKRGAAENAHGGSRRLSRQDPCMSVLIWCASFSMLSAL